ncbi:MAG: DUF2807 domain-containing protein [Chloroflexi bacterium]|nr:DUF2807 domain-containing protein [Chloroflexota bacterium]
MNKNWLYPAFLATILLAFTAGCAVGVNRTETRAIQDVSAISINTVGDFIIKQGDQESLTIEAPNNYLRYISTDVIGGTLYIDSERGIFGSSVQRIVYTITVKNLNELSLSGAGSVSMHSLNAENLSVNLTGAGSIDLYNLNAQSLSVLLNSAGSIHVSGTVDSQIIELNGLGSYEAADLQSRSATISLAGAGSADLWVTDNLDISVSGVGSVSYYGFPTVQQNISGVGSVNNKGNK